MSKEIKFKYEKSKDYRTIAVTGAYGGLNHQQELAVEFFVDKHPLPEISTIDIAEDGTGKVKFEKQKADEMIREVQISMVLRPDIAYSIGNWLINKAKEAGVKTQTKKETSKDKKNVK